MCVQLWRRTVRYYKLFKKPIIGFGVVMALAIAYKLLPYVIISTMKQPPIMVNMEIAQEEEWAEEIEAIGTILAAQAITISPEVGGIVSAIHFESGDTVAQGTPLVTLNDTVEQAELQRYKVQLDIARLTRDRSKKLSSKKVRSVAEYEQKKAQVEEIEAMVEQAQAIIRRKNILAPFTGKLGIRQVNVGDYIQPGAPIVTLTNSDKLFINFNLPERYAHVIEVGQKIVFQVDAYEGEVFEGHITTIDPQITKDIRNIAVQASADNDNDKLKSGMFAHVRIILPQEQKSITVPESAIEYGLYGSTIYIVDTDKKGHMIARKQFVKTGVYRGGKVAIVEGVQPGEKVVTMGQLKLQNGAPIAISEEPTPALLEVLPKP